MKWIQSRIGRPYYKAGFAIGFVWSFVKEFTMNYAEAYAEDYADANPEHCAKEYADKYLEGMTIGEAKAYHLAALCLVQKHRFSIKDASYYAGVDENELRALVKKIRSAAQPAHPSASTQSTHLPS